MTVNDELTGDDELVIELEPTPDELELDDQDDTPEAGDDSPETLEPDEDEEDDDDALDAKAELRLIKRGKYPKPAPAQPEPVDDDPEPDIWDQEEHAAWRRRDNQRQNDILNEPILRPALTAQVEKNLREFCEKRNVELPEEAYEKLREEASSGIPMQALRNAVNPVATANIFAEFSAEFVPVPKAAPPKATPKGASIASGVATTAAPTQTLQLKGEDADAYRSWVDTFGVGGKLSKEQTERFLKAIGRKK
jgi:hypothetical protein